MLLERLLKERLLDFVLRSEAEGLYLPAKQAKEAIEFIENGDYPGSLNAARPVLEILDRSTSTRQKANAKKMRELYAEAIRTSSVTTHLSPAGHGKDPNQSQLVMAEVIDVDSIEIEDLSGLEQAQFENCEHRIERGIEGYVEAGAALKQIRDLKLYRAQARTFDEYCQSRWRIGRQRGYQLIEAAQVCENLSKILDKKDLPAIESHARELCRLPEESRAEVWAAVLADSDRPTAKKIREASGLSNPDRHDVHLTPPRIVKAVLETFKTIDLDPCSERATGDNPNIPATRHYTKSDNGLALGWYGNIYVNPPYSGNDSTMLDWVDSAETDWINSNLGESDDDIKAIIWLVPAYTDTIWWHKLMRRADMFCLLKGRQVFADFDKNPQPHSARFPSAVILCCRVNEEAPARFREAFADLGYIAQGVDV